LVSAIYGFRKLARHVVLVGVPYPPMQPPGLRGHLDVGSCFQGGPYDPTDLSRISWPRHPGPARADGAHGLARAGRGDCRPADAFAATHLALVDCSFGARASTQFSRPVSDCLDRDFFRPDHTVWIGRRCCADLACLQDQTSRRRCGIQHADRPFVWHIGNLVVRRDGRSLHSFGALRSCGDARRHAAARSRHLRIRDAVNSRSVAIGIAPLSNRWIVRPVFGVFAIDCVSPHRLWRLLVSSIAIQLAVIVIVYVLAMGLSLPVTFVHCLLIVPTSNLVQAIPISIAGWGLREGFFVFAFGQIGIPSSDALALSVLYGLISLLASLPGAVVWMTFRRQPVTMNALVVRPGHESVPTPPVST
jgi:hypothetical protein